MCARVHARACPGDQHARAAHTTGHRGARGSSTQKCEQGQGPVHVTHTADAEVTVSAAASATRACTGSPPAESGDCEKRRARKRQAREKPPPALVPPGRTKCNSSSPLLRSTGTVRLLQPARLPQLTLHPLTSAAGHHQPRQSGGWRTDGNTTSDANSELSRTTAGAPFTTPCLSGAGHCRDTVP